MQNQLSRYRILAKRWAWMVLLAVVLCGGASYAISKLIHPVYQASALIVLNMGSSSASPYESTSASLAALPTYAQLLTSSAILKPVTAQHSGLTLTQLTSMISVKPQTNTQIIELDVQSTNPLIAMQLANEVSQSFAQYTNARLPATIQIFPAELPTTPVSPKASSNTVIGTLVGLVLALALIVVFEWIDDRLSNAEEVQEILALDTLAILPQVPRKQSLMDTEKIPTLAEACRLLCASLNAAQAIKPFTSVMITSALPGEGKSTIAVNVASFLAMAGKKVLLVDANLRHPVLDQHFQLDNHHGLSSVFLEKGTRLETGLDGRLTDIQTLRVLTTGALPSNPAEMLQSPLAHQLFDLFNKSPRFDYVIFDAPPLLPVADAQILAAYVQATVLVIDASKTPRKILLDAKRVLSRTPTTIIGVALNKSPWPDYRDVRRYLDGLQQGSQQPKVKFDITMLPQTPPVESMPSHIPVTPPINENGNGKVDLEIAMTPTPPVESMPSHIPVTLPINENGNGKVDLEIAMTPTPPINENGNGKVDLEITMTLPHQDKDEGEKV